LVVGKRPPPRKVLSKGGGRKKERVPLEKKPSHRPKGKGLFSYREKGGESSQGEKINNLNRKKRRS